MTSETVQSNLTFSIKRTTSITAKSAMMILLRVMNYWLICLIMMAQYSKSMVSNREFFEFKLLKLSLNSKTRELKA